MAVIAASHMLEYRARLFLSHIGSNHVSDTPFRGVVSDLPYLAPPL